MTGLPSGVKVEVEFVAGTWTDITADVDAKLPMSWHVGRTSPFTDPSSGQVTVTVANATGLYTPQRQVLADGVTAHPYWPNVDVRKRIRISYTIGGTQYVRYVGYIKQWLPQLADDGMQQQCQIVASDRLDQLSRVANLKAAFLQSILSDSPFALWTNTEPSGSTYSLDVVGGSRLVPLPGIDGAAVWGSNAPVPSSIAAEGLTALTFTAGSTTGQAHYNAFAVPSAAATTWSIEWWGGMTGPGSPLVSTIVGINVQSSSGSPSMSFSDHKDGTATGAGIYLTDSANPALTATGPATANDGVMHHYMLTGVDNGTTLTVTAYVDGAVNCTAVGVSGGGGLVGSLIVPAGRSYLTLNLTVSSELTNGAANVFGPIALYSTALSAARIGAHAALGIASAQRTGWHITEYLHWAGVAAADTNIDAGRELVAGHPTAGKNVVQCCLEMSATEGGGAVFYLAPDGRARFADRTFRKPGSPVMTVDAGADLDAGTFAPSYDELTLINSSTVARNGGNAQTFTDAASSLKYNLTAEPGTTSYASTDAAVLFLAQWRVRSQCTPGLRLAQVAVDLLTATSANLYLTLAAVQIGSRLRGTSLDATASARSLIDLMAEGWTETVAIDQYTILFDTSPADNPALFVLDSATYGRLSPAPGAATLQTAISAAATTVKISMASGPTFTLVPGMYPLSIGIGAEVLTLTAPPSGSTSPQTFTGVLRGQSGTPAAAQSVGSLIKLAPSPTLTL